MTHTFAICAYGDSPYLENCIRSLVRQPGEPEIILCTSTPSAFIEELAWRYGIPVHVRIGESNIQDDWNFAYDTARGDLVTLAHQDEDGNWVLNEIPDYGAELAKCQRYLIPMDANSCWGFAESNTSAYLYLPLPVSMRTTPVFQGNLPPTLLPGGNSVTSISVFSPSAIESMIALHVVGTGFIAQNCYSLNQPIGFLAAEL